MADTILNTILPSNTWVDLYADTDIIVGTRIQIQNLGAPDVYVRAQATQPTDEDGYQLSVRSEFVVNEDGDSGAWAFCLNADGLINVRVA